MTPREQLLSDILVSAVEGGSNYWANDRAEDGTLQVYDINRDENLDILSVVFDLEAVENVAGAYVRADLQRSLHDGRTLVTVDHAAIRRALRTISEAKVKRGARIKALARAIYFNDIDDVDYDASDADVILQVALFGDVIYG